jgi:hypothetical protein
MSRATTLLCVALSAGSAETRLAMALQQAPRVLLDEGHHNFHTTTTGYAAYTRLLRQNGFVVSANPGRVTADVLKGIEVFFIVSPGPESNDVLAQKAAAAAEPLNWSAAAAASAFSPDEIALIERWVRGGGSLLLVLDHSPFSGAGSALAAAFGVKMGNVNTFDSAFSGPDDLRRNAGFFVYTRATQSLGVHPVLSGVDRIVTYTGTSMQGPPSATVLFRLPDTASDRFWDAQKKAVITQSAAGRAQAVALDHGNGRVIVLGEAGMLAAGPGTGRDVCGTSGLADPALGNRRFALNIAQWLARREISTGDVTFVNTGCAPLGLTLVINAEGDRSVFAGTWTADLAGTFIVNLTLAGSRVEGTFGDGLYSQSVTEGTVTGTTVSFKIRSPNGERTVRFAGALEGDAIRFTRQVDVRPGGPPGGTGMYGVGGPASFVVVRRK